MHFVKEFLESLKYSSTFLLFLDNGNKILTLKNSAIQIHKLKALNIF